MTPSKLNPRLGLLIVIYLILATLYSLVTPIGRGADEWAHYWYAQFIAQHGRLPLTPAERETAGYKSDWPPLYHLLAAALTGWIKTEGPPTFKYRADNIRRQLVPAQGPEAILHTEDERFPWRQEILIWRLGRFLSIGLSALTLWVTYQVAVEVFETISPPAPTVKKKEEEPDTSLSSPRTSPGSRAKFLALVAVAFLAFNPRFLFTGMLFNYDSLTLLVATVFLRGCIRVAIKRYLPGGFWTLGLLAGLALLTKYLTVLLPLLLFPVALWGARLTKTEEGFTQGKRRLTRHLGQAALVYLLVSSGWFGYLLLNFNEIERYGLVLGILAPLLRGDSSDRTVEEIFAWMSGGQAPQPDYIDKPHRTAWQIISEFPLTLWGNPITRPYPLQGFTLVMSGLMLLAALGLVLDWRNSTGQAGLRHPVARLLLLSCLLPLPLMLIRLFGARDPLEAVQGRHLLFLAGPALAILFIRGLHILISRTTHHVLHTTRHALRFTFYVLRFTFYTLLSLLLTGALGQLLLLRQGYPPPLPVQTTAISPSEINDPPQPQLVLPGGARLAGFLLSRQAQVLQVRLLWRGGEDPAPEDYQTELTLVDGAGRVWMAWRAYQTGARYPTRVWEAGDWIRDEGWLPLAGVPAGEYEIRLRLLGEKEAEVGSQRLAFYRLERPVPAVEADWALWQAGIILTHPPLLREREMVQVTFEAGQPMPRLVGPDGVGREPREAGDRWANFIVAPNWPAGDYRLAEVEANPLLFQVAQSSRNFQIPPIPTPLEVNFAGKIALLGYNLPSRRIKTGEGIPLTLYWQGLEWMGEEFVIFTRLLDNQQAVWGGYDRLAQENYSTLLWAPGEIIVDGFAVPVAPDTPEGIYSLSLGWYHRTGDEAQSLPILEATGQPSGVTSLSLGSIKIGGPPPGVTVIEAAPQVRLAAELGNQIRLLGFDLNLREAGTWPMAQPVQLTFYWQPLVDPQVGYTIFVHLRRQAGKIVAQADGPPAGGRYPTSLWQTGEIIKDEVSLPPVSLEPGAYELVVGMYDFATGQRLPVSGSPDHTILLQAFEVKE